MTVSFGTRALATAFTIFAPSLAMPPCSYFLPTMKPVMFCKKRSGTPRAQQSSMKCVVLSADSEKRTPLFAMMPTGYPCRCAKPVTIVGASRDHLADVVLLPRVARDDAVELRRIVGRRLRRDARDGAGRRLRQRGE